MNIQRNTTKVVSVSLPKKTIAAMERLRKSQGRNRSNFIQNLIDTYSQDKTWQQIYQQGDTVGKKFAITSETDIDRILHEA